MPTAQCSLVAFLMVGSKIPSAQISRKCGSADALNPSSALHLPLQWIGPTHGDITAACVAKAFGVAIDTDPRALAILHEWVEMTGTEMNEARLRKALI
jgi:hypothetical protein